jgi:hypothetical protein
MGSFGADDWLRLGANLGFIKVMARSEHSRELLDPAKSALFGTASMTL